MTVSDKEFYKNLDSQMDRLRTKWPYANYERPKESRYGDFLILLPTMLLPKGWAATICTALFTAKSFDGKHWSPLNGFCVDLPDLRLEGGLHAQYSRPFASKDAKPFWHEPTESWWDTQEYVGRDFPQWKDLTRFWWRQQVYDPNYQSLYTSAMLVKQRLNPAR